MLLSAMGLSVRVIPPDSSNEARAATETVVRLETTVTVALPPVRPVVVRVKHRDVRQRADEIDDVVAGRASHGKTVGRIVAPTRSCISA